MKLRSSLLLILSSILILSSCTVEKRLHNKGYYVEWKSFKTVESKKISQHDYLTNDMKTLSPTSEITQEVVEISNEQETDKGSTESNQELTELKNRSFSKSIYPTSETTQKKKINSKEAFQFKSFTKKSKHLSLNRHISKPKRNEDDSENNKLAIIGLAMTLVSILVFPLVIPAIYMNAAALRQINREPNKFKNRYMALTAYIISLIFLGIAFTILVGLFLWFTLDIMLVWFLSAFLAIVVSSCIIINT